MARQKRFTKRLSVRLPEEIIKKLRAEARVRSVSMAHVVREAVGSLLRKLEKNDDEAVKIRESLRSSKEF